MMIALPSLRHLQVLEAVARLKSLTRASAEVHLTQPAVTQTIAKLEERAGAQLFERHITGTYLTEAGKLYLQCAMEVFHGIEGVLRQIRPVTDEAELARQMGKITRAQVRALIALSQSQSQAQAATLLGISQATLHRAARDLECNVGAVLYRRAATGVMTTAAGQMLACRLELASAELEEVCKRISSQQSATHHCIRFGAQVLDPVALLGSVMVEFTRSFPDAVVKVIHAPYDSLQQKLRAGALDFIVGVLKGAAPDTVDEPLFTDPYVIAARKGHPLAGKERIGVADLLRYDWVAVNEGAPRHAAFSRLFDAAGEMPSTTIETHSLATIRMALAQSDRLTLLTRSELHGEDMAGMFTALSYPGLHAAPVIGITSRRGWAPTKEKAAFLELLHAHGRALEENNRAVPAARPAPPPAWRGVAAAANLARRDRRPPLPVC